MTTGVVEGKTGTTPEAKGQVISPEAQGKTPEPASKVSPGKVYTQAEVDALIHAAKSEAGRDRKVVENELGTLKQQNELNKVELTENAAQIATLTAKIDDLASNDPARFNVIKELKAAMDERKQLKVEKQIHSETVQLAQDTMAEIHVWEVAAEYDGGDPVKLKDLCTTLKATSDEQVRKVADTLWAKSAVGTSQKVQPLPMKPYSGKTDGGSDRLGDLPPMERMKRVAEKLRQS